MTKNNENLHMTAITIRPGYWEAAADAAIKAVYADADLRLEALQLDILEPQSYGARWTTQQVKSRRIVRGLENMRDGLRETERALAEVGAAASEVASIFPVLTAAAAAADRDGYTFTTNTGDTYD